ncbi:LacI family DNA-binding transcriptional regulator [Paracoccus sp. (in: a-proteobacteria)]|uniref:LacI family DNA-binding transcriptional regulator n=1 Tax=Paracoccus sp. TaxID=267 RepID=UPI0028A1AD36|nr:LacI family DNA-binding transcriptional regulator [Paracoccus sp. (in: a-proteobacteria)]
MNDHAHNQNPVKISDVARLAGVSAATVSRVLSRPNMVAEATREAVLQAVQESGYRMNHAARNLRKQRTGAVVALVPNLGNPFFAKILAGLGRSLEEAGYDLLVGDTLAQGGRRRSLQRFLDPSRADGIVLCDGLVARDELLPGRGVPPVVMACEWRDDLDLPYVALDNATGTELAARHLVALGHRRFACIGGPPENILHRTRIEGVERVLGAQGFRVFPGDFSLDAGKRAAGAWLALDPAERPTGVISFSDEMAFAFVAELQRHGIEVPRDLSVVGFDDIELGAHLTPALTTVRQPKRDIGRLAAETMLAVIEGSKVASRLLIPPKLMVRQSTGPAPD